ncbi:MAG: hypothetical protein ABJN42_09945 [Roseibium sp.]|uniref:thermonuclease family protein n=1 Tax=Roseibium sp. TaxID=1936156 RepID=UPI00329A3EFC
MKHRRPKKAYPPALPLLSFTIAIFAVFFWTEERADDWQKDQGPRVLNGGDAWRGNRASRNAAPAAAGGELVDTVSRVRDGDTIVVGRTPVRIANLDCAESGSSAGDRATRYITRLVNNVQLQCALEGRRSYDREVGVCRLPDGRDVGEVLIAGGYCQRWRG